MIILQIDGENTVEVESDSSDRFEPRSRKGVPTAKFVEMLNLLSALGKEVDQIKKGAGSCLDTIELKIGLNLTAEGNFYVCKIGSTALLEATISWKA